jgi:hypothetical protein
MSAVETSSSKNKINSAVYQSLSQSESNTMIKAVNAVRIHQSERIPAGTRDKRAEIQADVQPFSLLHECQVPVFSDVTNNIFSSVMI